MKKLLLMLVLSITLSVFVFPPHAFAQAQAWGNCTETITDPAGNSAQIPTLRCIPVVFGNVVNAALMLVGTVAAFLFIWSGFKFVTSGGDPKQLTVARQILTYAIIGTVIVLLSFAIIYLISYLTGVKCIENVDLTSCQ